jgi:hypothetical protein
MMLAYRCTGELRPNQHAKFTEKQKPKKRAGKETEHFGLFIQPPQENMKD